MTALDAFRQLTESFTLDHLFSLIGIGLLSVWLMRTSLGRESLVHSPPRRNSMPPQLPFFALFAWLIGPAIAQWLILSLRDPVTKVQAAFQNGVVLGVMALSVAFGLVLPLASAHFARGLKGYGLRLRTVPRDLVAACVHLLAVWPLVLAAIVATMRIGQWISRWFSGQDFQMPAHEALRQMTEFSSVRLSVLLAFLAIVVAPLVEEMIFRGLFQTMIRSYLGRPWPAIMLTSALFAAVHANATHWPALFVLSVGLGYAYERSGSLFRPIFMHALFNGISILDALIDSKPA